MLLCQRTVLQDSKNLNDYMLKSRNMCLATYEEKHYIPPKLEVSNLINDNIVTAPFTELKLNTYS